jgi:Zn-dependent peptidase ImmA (M78 family)
MEKDRESQQEELEANEFARCLLMPESFIAKDIGKYRSSNGDLVDEAVHALAFRYKVSESLMRYRLIDLGYLSPL